MRDISRMFVITGSEADGWTSSSHTTFVIAIKGDYLTMSVKSGRNPLYTEVAWAIAAMIGEYQSQYGEPLPIVERKNRYRFCARKKISGARDYYIEYDMYEDGFPVRRHLVRVSCFDKVEGLSGYYGDYFDLVTTNSSLAWADVKDGIYRSLHRELAEGATVQILPPRVLEEEDGWTEPNQRPAAIVPLEVIRQSPDKKDEEVTEEEES